MFESVALPPRTKNLVGHKKGEYGAWTVLWYYGRRAGCTYWTCRCDCGTVRQVISASLVQHRTRSCNKCRSSSSVRTHAESGIHRTREYRAWNGMIARCTNPKNRAWVAYGQRGVSVCERWRGHDGYQNFLDDMGRCPPGMTLDREDTNGKYEPHNCRWATRKTQDRNKRNSLYLSLNGVRRHVIEWAKIVKITARTLHRRKNDGWSDERALTTRVVRCQNQVI